MVGEKTPKKRTQHAPRAREIKTENSDQGPPNFTGKRTYEKGKILGKRREKGKEKFEDSLRDGRRQLKEIKNNPWGTKGVLQENPQSCKKDQKAWWKKKRGKRKRVVCDSLTKARQIFP